MQNLMRFHLLSVIAVATASLVLSAALAPSLAYASDLTLDQTGLITPSYSPIEETSVIAADNVYCGPNATWSFDSSTGTLTITGAGALFDFEANTAPWYKDTYRTAIRKIVVSEGITYIGDLAFQDCLYLTSVQFPSTVTSLGSRVFSNCQKLTAVNLPSGMTEIGPYAFTGCKKLSNIVIPASVMYIAPTAFTNCQGLAQFTVLTPNYKTDGRSLSTHSGTLFAYANSSGSSYTIPSYVNNVYEHAFAYCNKLESVSIPTSVTAVGDFSFMSCTALSSITIPESVDTLGSYAFFYCTNLENISLPNSLTTLKSGTFSSCTSLSAITIPGTITTIENSVFARCTNFKQVTFEGNAPAISNYAFEGNKIDGMYPADNPSWNENTLLNYGGTINWISTSGDAHAHAWSEWVVTTPATCESDGVEQQSCACGKTNTRPISALGHNWDKGTVSVEATCNDDGLMTYTCLNDVTHTYKKPISAKGHQWDNGTVVTPATCNDDGVITFTCKLDASHTYTRQLDATGHTWDEGTVTKAPTCESEGTMLYTCTSDSTHTYTQPINATGHDWDEGVLKPAETCLIDGIMTYTCNYDHSHTYVEVISAFGGNHIWTDWVITVAPTDKAKGHGYRDCTRCGDHQEKDIDVLTGAEGFVYRLYANVLGRTPDSEGLAAQVAGMKTLGAAQITYNFFNSDEFKTKAESMSCEEQVELAYQTLLNRPADEDGKAMWTEYLTNGMSACALVAGFAESQEFANMCASYGLEPGSANQLRAMLEPRDRNAGITRFAARMYTVVLNRSELDTDGLNVQCNALLNGMAAWQLAVNFFTSTEFNNFGYTNDEIVDVAYRALLGRTGSAEEIASWSSQFGKNFGVVDLVKGFCRSNEFEAICKSCGMTSGMR